MTVCSNCGVENRPQARFCMNCGAALLPPMAAEATEVAEEVEIPAPPQEAAMPDQAQPFDGLGQPALQQSAEARLEAAAPLEASSTAEAPPDSDAPLAEPAETPEAFQEPPAQVGADAAPDEPAALSSAPKEEPALAEPEDVEDVVPPSTGEPGSPPLAAGTLLAGRFLIQEGTIEEASGRIYRALDRGSCGNCGAAITPEDMYCSQCGVELSMVEATVVRLQESMEMPEPAAGLFEDGGLWYQIVPPEPEGAPASAPAPATGWRLVVGQASHPGKVRELDEDSVLAVTMTGIYESVVAPTLGLFIVADGMGGHEGGEVASKLAVQVIAQHILQRIIWPELQGDVLLLETLDEQIREAFQQASKAIYELRRQRGSDMGTTVTMALVRNGLALIANVGDSRTYVWAAEGLLQLTRDHSLIADLIAAGQEPPEAIYTHPQRSLIYRNLGDSPTVEVDLFTLELEPGFRLILCCDGAWEMIRNEGIEEIMLQEQDPQRAAEMIVKWANDAGGDDNISAIVVGVEQVQ